MRLVVSLIPILKRRWLLLILASIGLELVVLALLPLETCSACSGTGAWNADPEFSGQCSAGCDGTGKRSMLKRWFCRGDLGPIPRAELPVPPPRSLSELVDTPLGDTSVVPAFTSVIPQGKNAVWCASFQLAWDRLRNDVSGEPIVLGSGGEALARRLNSGTFQTTALEDGSFYAAAGRAADGIVERIRRDMGKRFPDHPPALSDAGGSSIVAYAYLRASIKFGIPFFEHRSSLAFRDGTGKTHPVKSFGIRPEDDYAYYKLRAQVDVLYVGSGADSGEFGGNVSEFALDPDRESNPYQVIVAKVPRKDTLSDLWDYVEAKILGYARRGGDGIGCNETFLTPNISLSTTHHFGELEGENGLFVNPKMRGFRMTSAVQSIQFVLNRGGAELGSEAKVLVMPIPRHFIVDGPFLVVLRRRGDRKPFFALWVENPEVLESWK